MISIQSASKTYLNGVEALSDIDLNIGKEEFVFIVGPTGSGKSTLLKLLYREELPTKGKVIVDRVDIATLKPHEVPFLRRNIGVVFQDYKLLPLKTIYENVSFALEVMGASRAFIRRQVTQVLDLVGLLKKANSRPAELSGGEQQRVCIARAIVNNPPLLIADEPTGNLDPATSWEIMHLIDKINRRSTTVIVATHNKSIVDGMRKRVVALEAGRIIRDQQLGVYSNVI